MKQRRTIASIDDHTDGNNRPNKRNRYIDDYDYDGAADDDDNNDDENGDDDDDDNDDDHDVDEDHHDGRHACVRLID